MMKKCLLFTIILALMLSMMPAWAAQEDVIGKTFPDFTFTTTEGEEVTLSEVLKEKELVMVCIFASYCGPCKHEFPFMDEVYQEYADQFQIIALTGYPIDTMEVIRQYKADYDLSFAFGLEEGTGIKDFVDLQYYPTNIFIDRFGVVGYVQNTFPDKDSFERVVKTYLGDDYTETVELHEVPAPEMDVPYPDEADLAAALNVDGGALAFSNDPEGKAFPFVPEARDGHDAVFASNVGIYGTSAVLTTNVTAEAGDALSFEVGTNIGAMNTEVAVVVDGEVAKRFTGINDWRHYTLALEPGDHAISFNVKQVGGAELDDEYVGFDNVALLSGDEAAAALAAMPVYPEGEDTRIVLVNESGRLADIIWQGEPIGQYFYFCEDDTLRFRITLEEGLDPDLAQLYNSALEEEKYFSSLPVEDDAFIYECPNIAEDQLMTLEFADQLFSDDMLTGAVYFVRSEQGVEKLLEFYRAAGYDVQWGFVDELPEDAQEQEQEPEQESELETESTYNVTVIDQNGDAVPGVALQFCTEEACAFAMGDENGQVVFTGAPQVYEIHVLQLPDGYSIDPEFSLFTEAHSMDMTLEVVKD